MIKKSPCKLHPNDLTSRSTKVDEEKTYLVSPLPQSQMRNGSIKQLNLHNDWVMRVSYLAELRCVVSCSTDENTALALTQPECFKYQSAFSSLSAFVHKGVKCFAFCPSNAAIVTGGGDRILRIWLRGNYSEPTGRMKVTFTVEPTM